eukprot:4306912-Pyramimonas_sp.AAC.1
MFMSLFVPLRRARPGAPEPRPMDVRWARRSAPLTGRVPLLAKCLLASARKTHACLAAMYRRSPAADPGHVR